MARDDLAFADGAAAVDAPVPSDAHGDQPVLADALTIAWIAATLYSDPRTNEAFCRAVDVLRAAPRSPWAVEIGPGSFRSEAGPIESRREAADRLASRLFAHGVAAVGILSPPSAEDVVELFRVVDAEPSEGEDAPAALAEAGVTAIVLSRQPILMPDEDAELPEAEPGSDPTWQVAEPSGPEAFVARMLAEGEPDRVAETFLAEYGATLELVEQDDHWGREDVVHAFVDAFFLLPSGHQGRVLEEYLTHRDLPECLLFLDQFGGYELGMIAAHLEADAHPLLLEYARIAAQQGSSGRGDEFEAMLDLQGRSPQRLVMERIAGALAADLGGRDDLGPVGRLRDRLPTDRDHRQAGIDVLRGLLAVTDDDAAFHRLARTWAALVAKAIRDGDARSAGAWIRAASDDRGEERTRTLHRMLGTHLDREFLERLTEIVTDPSPAAEAVRAAAPGFAVDALVKRLGEEEDRGRRRVLIEALVAVASVDPRPLLKHLDDDRWFVVRNIAVVLGRAGHPEVSGRVRDVLHHPEPRVRRETLRTLFALVGDDSVPDLTEGLRDESHSVRRQALFLLRTPQDPAVDEALARYLKGDLVIGERLKVMEVLAARGTEPARALLERYASIQLGLTSTTRALRAAARRALGRHR